MLPLDPTHTVHHSPHLHTHVAVPFARARAPMQPTTCRKSHMFVCRWVPSVRSQHAPWGWGHSAPIRAHFSTHSQSHSHVYVCMNTCRWTRSCRSQRAPAGARVIPAHACARCCPASRCVCGGGGLCVRASVRMYVCICAVQTPRNLSPTKGTQPFSGGVWACARMTPAYGCARCCLAPMLLQGTCQAAGPASSRIIPLWLRP